MDSPKPPDDRAGQPPQYFPGEQKGEEVTVKYVRLPNGEVIPISAERVNSFLDDRDCWRIFRDQYFNMVDDGGVAQKSRDVFQCLRCKKVITRPTARYCGSCGLRIGTECIGGVSADGTVVICVDCMPSFLDRILDWLFK